MTFPTDETEARLLLSLHPKIGPVRFGHLLGCFPSAAAALAAPVEAWEAVEGFGSASRDFRKDLAALRPAMEKELAAVRGSGFKVISGADSNYPAAFRFLRDAPPVLYLWGTLRPRDELAVALVGSRTASPYGRAVAERLARELAEAGVTVVSGLARGVDAAAHAAALSSHGRTVGVLGSGFSRFYPPENRRLAERMAASGAVLTEFSLESPPEATHFPRRNRLIAALALGVVVVEARDKSGALITARLAADQGKDVFAVPGSVFSPGSRGPHRLLREGARPAESAEDILEEIRALSELMRTPRPAPAGEPEGPGDLAPGARRLLAALAVEPVGIDALAARTGLAPAEVATGLLRLELSGWARELPGKNYVRTERALPAVPSKKDLSWPNPS